MKLLLRYIIVLGCLGMAPVYAKTQVTDTLAEVRLHSKTEPITTKQTTPAQQLDQSTLSSLNVISVADAAKYFSGVVVKDYGGIGGLKTVSVRSLGASFTGLMYDGMMISDAQGGQVDLGRFSTDQLATVELYSIQPNKILLPARTFQAGSVLALTSAGPDNNQPLPQASIRARIGSFGFINPCIDYKGSLGKNISHGFNAEFQQADGDYKFTDYETGRSKTRRLNSDIRSTRLEYHASILQQDSSNLKLSAYFYGSNRGLPGAIIFYNLVADERLKNRNFFVQSSWTKHFSRTTSLLLSGKYTADYKWYLDPSYPNYAGKLINEFRQKEYYLSAVIATKILPSLTLGYGIDYFENKLNRSDSFAIDFANPSRSNFLNNLALQWKEKRMEFNGNLLYSYKHEKVQHGLASKDIQAFSPAASFSIQLLKYTDLRLRAAYKYNFRPPSFDDLYYTNIGNIGLRPEYAKQFNIGLTLQQPCTGWINQYQLTVDAYHNMVKDKILAVPRQNLFQWSMQNIGKVSANGLDASFQISSREWRNTVIRLISSYSFQHVLDISDPQSTLYKTQLPYVPKHSGSLVLQGTYKSFSAAINTLYSSYRYRLGDPGPENFVQGWTTQDVSIGYRFRQGRSANVKLLLELNNILDNQYEVIRFYPMPGFNYRIGITTTFKKQT